MHSGYASPSLCDGGVWPTRGPGLPVTAGKSTQLGAGLAWWWGSESQQAQEWQWLVVSMAWVVTLPLEGLVATCELQEEVLILLLPMGPLPR